MLPIVEAARCSDEALRKIPKCAYTTSDLEGDESGAAILALKAVIDAVYDGRDALAALDKEGIE